MSTAAAADSRPPPATRAPRGSETAAGRLVDHLAAGVLAIDRQNVLCFANSAACEMLALKPVDLGQPFTAGRYPPPLVEVVGRTRDSGREHWLDALPVAVPPGIAAGVHAAPKEDLVIVELFPSTVSAEERQSRERWARLEADALVFQGLCHDLRNPLGSLRGAAQLLEQETTANRRREYLELIVQQADRIAALIDRFGQPPVMGSTFNFHQLIDEVIAECRSAWGDEGQPPPEVRRDFDPSLPPLSGERPLIAQLLAHLLSNARAAGAGRIIITTRIAHQCRLPEIDSRSALALEIADDGAGVPPALADKIFLPLVSGRQNGTGLGLALSQRIARRHRGLLEYVPRPAGACFRLLLPLGPGVHQWVES